MYSTCIHTAQTVRITLSGLEQIYWHEHRHQAVRRWLERKYWHYSLSPSGETNNGRMSLAMPHSGLKLNRTFFDAIFLNDIWKRNPLDNICYWPNIALLNIDKETFTSLTNPYRNNLGNQGLSLQVEDTLKVIDTWTTLPKTSTLQAWLKKQSCICFTVELQTPAWAHSCDTAGTGLSWADSHGQVVHVHVNTPCALQKHATRPKSEIKDLKPGDKRIEVARPGLCEHDLGVCITHHGPESGDGHHRGVFIWERSTAGTNFELLDGD